MTARVASQDTMRGRSFMRIIGPNSVPPCSAKHVSEYPSRFDERQPDASRKAQQANTPIASAFRSRNGEALNTQAAVAHSLHPGHASRQKRIRYAMKSSKDLSPNGLSKQISSRPRQYV